MVSNSKNGKRLEIQQQSKAAQKLKQHQREVKQTLKTKSLKPQKPVIISKKEPVRASLSKEIEESRNKEKEMQKKRLFALNMLKKKNFTSDVDAIKDKILKDSSRAFVGDVKKLLDEANVIIEVLDARDPIGTRSLEAEKEIKARNKTLVFVLNKIDLVPVENMKGWLRYLCKEARVFPFKASCQEQARNIGGSMGKSVPNMGSSVPSSSYGVEDLVNYLKSLTKGSKAVGTTLDKLVVGVVGVPNTGKSSLINSLKRKRICEAGNTPGLTRNLQHIALDNHMTLIDSPGIILAKTSDPAEYALRNCVRVEKIEDSVSVAAVIFRRGNREQLQTIYKLKDFDSFEDFIVMLATRCCPLKKGGVANIRLASVKLINDWNSGKISYCTPPPTVLDGDASIELTEAQEAVIEGLTMKAAQAIGGVSVFENEEVQMSDDESEDVMDQ